MLSRIFNEPSRYHDYVDYKMLETKTTTEPFVYCNKKIMGRIMELTFYHGTDESIKKLHETWQTETMVSYQVIHVPLLVKDIKV